MNSAALELLRLVTLYLVGQGSVAGSRPGEVNYPEGVVMRVGFQVNRSGIPVEGAEIRGTLTTGFPFVPTVGITDVNGEWFGVAPIAVSPANYFMQATVIHGAAQLEIKGVFDEIENLFSVDLDAGQYTRERLSERIPGDSYWSPTPDFLSELDLIDLSGDPVRGVSSCGTCLYFVPLGLPSGQCLVNGLQTSPIPIADAARTSSPWFYPFFLHPVSPQRLQRDLSRLSRGMPPLEGLAAPCGALGDLDRNGIINQADLDILITYFGTAVDPGDPVHVDADLNGDGFIDIVDYAIMVEFLNSNIITFPGCA